jgi:hypothetical protein
LSHFKNIQEAHSVLSSSISIESNKEQQQQQQQQPQYPIQSYISSSSSTKSLNQPAVSSPLHTTESIVQTSSHEQQSPLKNKRSTSSLLRRPSLVDEDDSLVFKMSELGTTDDSIEKQKGKQPLKRQVDPPTCSKQHQSNL